jgi:selenocysteine lyase/cysteine desulfurase
VREAFGMGFEAPEGYLNTASIGLPPDDVAAAVTEAVAAWRAGAARAPAYDAPVETARAGFAALAGVAPERVAIGSTVSGLVGLVAACLPDGARVLVAPGEFTSVSFPFAAQAHRGVTVVEGDLARAAEFDLVATSVVQSADGAVADLDALRAARAAGTTVLLDATQSLGWHRGPLGWADVVVAAAYKWLLAPRGAAWMAVRPGLGLVPHAAGWYAGADRWGDIYGLPLRLAADARALDVSPAWFSHVGAAVALPRLAALDRAAVHAHCTGLAGRVRAGLGMPPADSAIVAVDRPGAAQRLAAAGIVAAARAGRARVAFHLYNTDDDVDRVLAALA